MLCWTRLVSTSKQGIAQRETELKCSRWKLFSLGFAFSFLRHSKWRNDLWQCVCFAWRQCVMIQSLQRVALALGATCAQFRSHTVQMRTETSEQYFLGFFVFRNIRPVSMLLHNIGCAHFLVKVNHTKLMLERQAGAQCNLAFSNKRLHLDMTPSYIKLRSKIYR
jgi:hypothetical protein